ncbi:MAG: phosphate acyltransferase PlsX [Bacteroidales bacterium]|nr:phosphate acyltransferase PlsX [Bacteroidales bacterium]
MRKIGIDIMGGDYAPEATTLGVIEAKKVLPEDISLVLIGDKAAIEEILIREGENVDEYEIAHASEVISMNDHPIKAFSKKQDSSIAVGFRLLMTKKIDGFASAGNTGAMLAGTMYTVKQVPGIIRPCLIGPLPRPDGSFGILLDVGLNPDCKPDILYQYAILGDLYAKHVYNVENPKVALLNLGEEEEKGSLLTKATYELMKGTTDFNFVGNVEGNDLFVPGKSDVIITDGFTGNVVLKQSESFYHLFKQQGIDNEYINRFNPDIYGGTPVLGVNAPIIVGHGASNKFAIKNMILHTKSVIEAGLVQKIKEAFENE